MRLVRTELELITGNTVCDVYHVTQDNVKYVVAHEIKKNKGKSITNNAKALYIKLTLCSPDVIYIESYRDKGNVFRMARVDLLGDNVSFTPLSKYLEASIAKVLMSARAKLSY